MHKQLEITRKEIEEHENLRDSMEKMVSLIHPVGRFTDNIAAGNYKLEKARRCSLPRLRKVLSLHQCIEINHPVRTNDIFTRSEQHPKLPHQEHRISQSPQLVAGPPSS
jgi:hypothetical protein